jgi:NAD(P)H-dependent FMN reductase
MEKLTIGIVVGSTREGRVGLDVAKWVQMHADKAGLFKTELVDIKTFDLPFLGTTKDQSNVEKWNEKLFKLDGFVFVTSEYNHGLPASLKNALDSARDAWANKVAGIVSYGSVGGARATEHLRGIAGELQMADVRSHVALSLFHDFKDFAVFSPNDAVHQGNLDALFNQINSWGTALKTIR